MFVTMNRDIKIIALYKNSYETSVNRDFVVVFMKPLKTFSTQTPSLDTTYPPSRRKHVLALMAWEKSPISLPMPMYSSTFAKPSNPPMGSPESVSSPSDTRTRT
jgi:hypothetical protein